MGHSTSLVHGDPVLCGGQRGESAFTTLKGCSRFMVETGQWATMHEMLERRSDHSVVQLDEGRFWIAGNWLLQEKEPEITAGTHGKYV